MCLHKTSSRLWNRPGPARGQSGGGARVRWRRPVTRNHRSRWAGEWRQKSLMGIMFPQLYICGLRRAAVRAKSPVFVSALTGALFSAFVLCLSDVCDQLQSVRSLTAFLHQPAFSRSFKTAFFLPCFGGVLAVCGAVITHSRPAAARQAVDLRLIRFDYGSSRCV